MQISLDQKGIIHLDKKPNRLMPAVFSLVGVLLLITAGAGIFLFQQELTISRQSVNQAAEPGKLNFAANQGCFAECGTICTDHMLGIACRVNNPDQVCYQQSQCVRQPSGQCGWTNQANINMCLSQTRPTPSPIVFPTPAPSCIPRPACLDAKPACKILMRPDYCPPKPQPPICNTNADCPPGNMCIQPSMPACPPGLLCPQVMPAKICIPYATPTPMPTIQPPITSPTQFDIADLNHDGKVNLIDYSLLVENFLTNQSSPLGDLNGDGKVDLADYSIFVVRFNP